MIRAPVSLAPIAIAFLATAGIGNAQDETLAVVPIVVRPAPAPVPALKYRMLPERNSLVQGNAALFYHRAIEMILDRWRVAASAREKDQTAASDEQAAIEWVDGPLASIPLDRAHRWLHLYRSALHEAELGARRGSCDWEFDFRPDGIDLHISEVQNMRFLARLVMLRARVAIRESKPHEAVYWLQTGFAMARHVSEGPFLIQSLVGIAMSAMLNRAVEDLIQAPGMPSLYWALANRPHPFIDLSRALEGERFLLERELPQLLELDGISWSVEKARAFLDAFQATQYRFNLDNLQDMGYLKAPVSGPVGIQDWSKKLGVAALVAQAYPEARRALIAQGRTAAQVEAMPTVQVAALHAFQTYQQFRDDVFKWTGLPYYQAYRGMDAAWRGHNPELQRRHLLRLFTLFLPAIQASYLAAVRMDRQLDALECIEAIRIHAATYKGFPSRLEDITEAPVPLDPMTGQPFGYRVEGDRATLTAPHAPGAPRIAAYAIDYELKLAH